MISLQIEEGKEVKMGTNTSIQLEVSNNIFDDEILSGEGSLPISVPYHANARIINHLHALFMSSRKRQYDFSKLYYGGIKIFDCITDILEVSDEALNLSIRTGISALPVFNRKLSELPLGTFYLGATQSEILDFVEAQNLENYPNVRFIFPMIRNERFYDGKNPDFQNYINHYIPGGSMMENVTTNRNTLVPMAFLHHVLKVGFSADGYDLLEVGYMANPTEKRAYIYNNYSIDKKQTTSSFASSMVAVGVTNNDFNHGVEKTIVWVDDAINGLDPLNKYNPSNGEYTIAGSFPLTLRTDLEWFFPGGTPTAANHNIEVRMYVNGVVKQTHALSFTTNPGSLNFTFNYFPTVGEVGQIIKFRMIYTNSASSGAQILLDTHSQLLINYFPVTGLNTYKSEVDLSQHMPDLTFGQLLADVKLAKCLRIVINHRTKQVILDQFDDIFDQDPVDFSTPRNKAIAGHKISFNPTKGYKSFIYDAAEDDELRETELVSYDPTSIIATLDSRLILEDVMEADINYLGKLVRIRNANIILRCEFISGIYSWKFFSHDYFPEIIDKDQTIEIIPLQSPLLMKEITDYVGQDYLLLPQIKQVGSSDEFELGKNSYGLHIMYYHGFDSTDYPHSSSTLYDPVGNKYAIPGVGPLMGGMIWKDGLGEKFNLKIKFFNRGEVVEKRLVLSFTDLMNFDITRIHKIEEHQFLFISMEADLSEQINVIAKLIQL